MVVADDRQRGLLTVPDVEVLLGRLRAVTPLADALVASPGLLTELIRRDAANPRNAALGRAGLVLSLNRSGLAGAAWEIDDRLTATIRDASRWGVEAVKLSVRISLEREPSSRQLELLGEVVREADAAGLPLLVEPAFVRAIGSHLATDYSGERIKIAAAVCGEYGAPALLLPYPDGETRSARQQAFEHLVRAVTAPIVLLGGPRHETREDALEEVQDALEAGAAGAAMGTDIYQDPESRVIAHALALVVHAGLPADVALAEAEAAAQPA
jgi:fructose-bisphosphate aldolase/2-amino-3,7-dideoxy-D-threo-hept-6-ulosonate synthase